MKLERSERPEKKKKEEREEQKEQKWVFSFDRPIKLRYFGKKNVFFLPFWLAVYFFYSFVLILSRLLFIFAAPKNTKESEYVLLRLFRTAFIPLYVFFPYFNAYCYYAFLHSFVAVKKKQKKIELHNTKKKNVIHYAQLY